ncbi:MAG: 3-methyl-2-oxobutanoate hydroxymethyltransferase [Gemmatimonadetes bacterium]|nr:3-methyl-2-oxobutanoate hydroxymethyltransferase [Gemmatimonadota bacterium]
MEGFHDLCLLAPRSSSAVSTESPSAKGRPNIRRFQEMKKRGERIVMLTAYDALFARLLEQEGVDLILVGDSLSQVVLGYDSTLPVTLEQMMHHASAVRRGAPGSFVVVDLPFLSYQVSIDETIRNGGRVLKETGAQAVKLEGGDARTCSMVEALVTAGIPVMGHLGLRPQSIHALGGYLVQGRGEEAAKKLCGEARALERAGAFAIVLELVPGPLAQEVTAQSAVPTIGIGAGAGCDGQVLVLYDALGLNEGFRPRFLKQFADLENAARAGIRAYAEEVRAGTYPGPEQTFGTE